MRYGIPRTGTMANNYIYYDYLGEVPKSEHNSKLKVHAILGMYNVGQFFASYDDQIAILTGAAENERAKESRLLSRFLGEEFDMDSIISMEGEDTIKILNDNINRLLNIADVYNRNKALIENTKGQYSLMSFVLQYFDKYWNKQYPELLAKIKDKIFDDAKLEKIIEDHAQKCLEESLKIMLGATEVENGIKNDYSHYEKAYMELYDAIGQVWDKDSLSGLIYRAMGFDNIVKELTKAINADRSISKTKMSEINTKGWLTKKGFALEAFETSILQQVAERISSENNYKHSTESIWSGSANAKPDIILAINTHVADIKNTLRRLGGLGVGKSGRIENVNAFNELGKRLSKIKDSFIVYVNAKNYKLDGSYGIHSGSDITMDTYKSIMSTKFKDIGRLCGTIMQYSPGAIGNPDGDEELPNELTNVIATQLAYFLFDDFVTIGTDLKSSGNAIHVMNINGIYMPLSSVLFIMVKALKAASVDNSIIDKKYVDAKVKLKPILYSKEKWQEMLDNGTVNSDSNLEKWQDQREYALKNTTFQVNFFQNFKEILSEYFDYI